MRITELDKDEESQAQMIAVAPEEVASSRAEVAGGATAAAAGVSALLPVGKLQQGVVTPPAMPLAKRQRLGIDENVSPQLRAYVALPMALLVGSLHRCCCSSTAAGSKAILQQINKAVLGQA